MHVEHELVTAPIPALLRKLGVPAGIGFFFNTMFNVADTFYAGLVSTSALAALSLSFPVFFLIIANGSGISTGTTALIAHALGSDDREEALHLASQAISFAFANALLVTLTGLLVAPYLFHLLGARPDYLGLALSYINPLFMGSIFFILNYVCNAILNATGDSRSFRNFLVTGCFANLLLDPWFLMGGAGLPPLGVPGIAWATVVIQGTGNLYLLTRVIRTGMLHGFRWSHLIPRRRAYFALAKQGFPSSLNMMTVASGIFLITWFVGRFGGDAVAAYGIATRIEQIALLPALGMNVGILAIVAQNSGARRIERVMETVRRAYLTGASIMLFGSVVIFLCAVPLMALFTKDPTVRAIGVSYLHIESFVFVAYSILYASVAILQGLKRPLFPLVVGLGRQVALPLPVFFVFCDLWGWGIYGVWWGIFLVTWLGALAAFWFVSRTLDLLAGRRRALFGGAEAR